MAVADVNGPAVRPDIQMAGRAGQRAVRSNTQPRRAADFGECQDIRWIGIRRVGRDRAAVGLVLLPIGFADRIADERGRFIPIRRA